MNHATSKVHCKEGKLQEKLDSAVRQEGSAAFSGQQWTIY